MKLLIATNNQGKQKEFTRMLGDLGYDLIYPNDLSLSNFDVEETGKTAKENAFLKAKEFAYKSGLVTIADDSGLEVEALDGAPGIHSKRFHLGGDQDRNNKIIDLLASKNNRKALFRTVLCLVDPRFREINEEDSHFFEGIFNGSIAFKEKGQEGFGYDPIFIPNGETKTVAQLGMKYKNDHSHRAIAINKLKKFLNK